MIHGHGNNLYEYAGAIRMDFSSNIAFNNNAPEILTFLQGVLPSINNYPDPGATILAGKIAKYHGIPPEAVLVTNGSAEAFYLIAHFLAESKSIVCIPSFAEYEDACKVHKHILNFIPVKDFPTSAFTDYQSVWLGSPNNPDGLVTPAKTIVSRCKQYPKTCFVIDLAYAHLTSEKDVHILQHGLPDNLIAVHSLTKEFAIPGLRLGYITAPPAIISALSDRRPPWSVNALALKAGEFIMDNYDRLLPSLSELLEESYFLQKEMAGIGFLEVTPSPANYFLSRVKKGTAAWLKKVLIEKYGILIRDASNFRGLEAANFRVAARSRQHNMALIKTLQEICKDNQSNNE